MFHVKPYAQLLVTATVAIASTCAFFAYLSARAALVPEPDPIPAPVEMPMPPSATAMAAVHRDCARRGLGIRITLPYRNLSRYVVACEDAT